MKIFDFIKHAAFKGGLIAVLTAFSIFAFAADDAALKEGQDLFKANCASCHNKNMKDKLTGPPLGKTAETWGAYPKKDLYNWIRNSQKMIASGHPRATEIWNEYKPTVMTNFPNLTDAQIDNILAYIDGVYAGTFGAPKATDAKAGAAGATTTKSSNLPFYAFLLGVLVILSLVLAKLVTNLNFLANQKEGKPAKKLTFSELLTSRSVIALLVFFLVVLGGYTTVNNAISLGRQQGYQPEQPIKF